MVIPLFAWLLFVCFCNCCTGSAVAPSSPPVAPWSRLWRTDDLLHGVTLQQQQQRYHPDSVQEQQQIHRYQERHVQQVNLEQDGPPPGDATSFPFLRLPMFRHFLKPVVSTALFHPVPGKEPLPDHLTSLLFPPEALPTPPPPARKPQQPNAEVWCNDDKTVTVRVDRFRLGLWASPDRFRLGSCPCSEVTPQFIYFHYKLSECQGTFTTVNGPLEYRNSLVFTPPPQGRVVRAAPLDLPIYCHYNRFHYHYSETTREPLTAETAGVPGTEKVIEEPRTPEMTGEEDVGKSKGLPFPRSPQKSKPIPEEEAISEESSHDEDGEEEWKRWETISGAEEETTRRRVKMPTRSRNKQRGEGGTKWTKSQYAKATGRSASLSSHTSDDSPIVRYAPTFKATELVYPFNTSSVSNSPDLISANTSSVISTSASTVISASTSIFAHHNASTATTAIAGPRTTSHGTSSTITSSTSDGTKGFSGRDSQGTRFDSGVSNGAGNNNGELLWNQLNMESLAVSLF